MKILYLAIVRNGLLWQELWRFLIGYERPMRVGTYNVRLSRTKLPTSCLPETCPASPNTFGMVSRIDLFQHPIFHATRRVLIFLILLVHPTSQPLFIVERDVSFRSTSKTFLKVEQSTEPRGAVRWRWLSQITKITKATSLAHEFRDGMIGCSALEASPAELAPASANFSTNPLATFSPGILFI